MTILVHGYSKSVIKVLESAAERGLKISVFTTECQPSNLGKGGKEVQKFCETLHIPCKTILDSAVGMCISSVDCVFVGAEAVLENGGIANRIGTFTVALCAKAYNKPFYVFAESLKFLKSFPLQQSDILHILEDYCDSNAPNLEEKNNGPAHASGDDISKVNIDYTPPEYISCLFTDIGIFTPAAVSDELIKFF